MNREDIRYLVSYCDKTPELYNAVMNHLWYRFKINSAEIGLIITYYINEDRRKSEDLKCTTQ